MHNFASSSENLIQFRKKIEDLPNLLCEVNKSPAESSK